MRPLLAALICLLAALSTPAAAQGGRPERIARARQLFQEGATAYAQGDLTTALSRMKAAQRAYRQPEFAYNIARVLERMGEAPHAISWFRVYLRHGRPTPEERADVEARMQALEQLQTRQAGQIFAAPPSGDELTQEARTFFERGVAMYQRGQNDAAMQAFTAAMHFAPFPELYYNMALTAERLERWQDARDYYREYLRMRPRAPDREAIERRRQELLEIARRGR